MNRRILISALVGSLLAVTGLATQAEEAPAPVILETWACNYNDGQDRDNLLAARDYMVRQAAKAEVQLADSYVWHRAKGDPGVDHVWFSVHESVEAWAAEAEAFASAPELADVDERFDRVATCVSNMGNAHVVFQGSEVGEPGGNAFISSNACHLRHGVTPADLTDLEGHIRGVLSNIPAYNDTSVILVAPMTGGPTTADLYLFSVNPSPSAWAADMSGFQAADPQSLVRHFASTLDCTGSLWNSEQVVGGED